MLLVIKYSYNEVYRREKHFRIMSNTINLYQQYNRLIPIIADLQQLAEPEESLRNATSIITRLSGYTDAQDLGQGIQHLVTFIDHSIDWLTDYNAHIDDDRYLIKKYGVELHRLRKFANLQMSMLLCELSVLNNKDHNSMLFFSGDRMASFIVPDQQIIYAADKTLFNEIKRLYHVGGRFTSWRDFLLEDFERADEAGEVRGEGFNWKITFEILHILDLIMTTTINRTDLMKYYKSAQFAASIKYLQKCEDEFSRIDKFIQTDYRTAIDTYGNEETYLYTQIIDLVKMLQKFLSSIHQTVNS